MNIGAERERLSQAEVLARLKCGMQITEMVTVYLSDRYGHHSYRIYCALILTTQIEQILNRPTWDLSYGEGLPGAVQHWKGDETITEYCRFGDVSGIEPLVIDREFHGIRPDYKELSEEFRLFHRLYHDRKEDHYIKINNDGNEHLVAIIEPNRMQVRLKEIRQFLAIKEMHLAIQFDYREHSASPLEELGLEKGGGVSRSGLMCWGLCFGDFGGIGTYRAFSRLMGKSLIPPLPKEKSGIWGFAAEDPKKYVDFIIGVDEDGDKINHTSDPDALANFFGANPDAAHYLKPVHFRKQVLEKYYQQPAKYTVEDGILRCGSLWSMSLDNHHDDKVCAWLGDLGCSLPYDEQLHWRSYNIVPTGDVSETYCRRQILAQATDSDRPEHVFRERYDELVEACEKRLGWRLLLPLAAEDAHHFQCLRVPATDGQKDFDDLVLGLSKILIDSLNEEALNNLIPPDVRGELKGSLSRLEAALAACGIDGYQGHIEFLRKLQNLRSSGSAHRKGSNYHKIARDFGVDSQNLRKVFHGILDQALDVLEYLIGAVRSQKLSADDGAPGSAGAESPK